MGGVDRQDADGCEDEEHQRALNPFRADPVVEPAADQRPIAPMSVMMIPKTPSSIALQPNVPEAYMPPNT